MTNTTLSGRALVKWQDEFSVGIEAIDDQHKKLLTLINALWDATVSGAPVDQLLSHIDELERYTGYHFADEENAMRAASYPGMEEHCQAHRNFIERIATEKRQVGKSGYVSLDLVRFLQDWLLRHIAVQDKHYATHVLQGSERLSFFTRLLRRFS